MPFSTSVTIWWRLWDFRCPLSHLSDCSHKQCRACFPQGMKLHVCVSFSACHRRWPLAWCVQHSFKSPQYKCWKSTLSVLWHPQPPPWRMQFTNMPENARHATEQLEPLYKSSAVPGGGTWRDVWHQVGMSATESMFAELSQTLLLSLKYLLLRLRL